MTLKDSLTETFGRPGRIAFEQSPLGGVVIRLSAPGGTALVALQGAQVLSWTPAGTNVDVLWLSPQSRIGTGKPLRGGIPVCWPWFGAHPDPTSGAGAHGFVRAADWRVLQTKISETLANVTLGFELSQTHEAQLGGPASLQLDVIVATALDVSLTTQNIGTAPISISEALHSYFTVGDIASVELTGLEGRQYLDQLSNKAFEQTGSIAIPAETDRIYWNTLDTIVIHDAGLNRRIAISKTGSASTVVWNPWQEKSARLGDMADGAFRHIVCVETANVGPHNLVSIAPGQSHTMAMRVEIDVS